MDFLTKKEIEGLKQDIEAKNIAVEADKYSFEYKLLNGFGESMMEELRNPQKPNKWNGFKAKISRWRKIRQEKKEQKKILREINCNKKEMGGI